MRTMPGRSRSLALSPASTITSSSSTSWTVAIARIFSTCASSETPRSACLSVETRTYPIPFVFIFQKKLDHTSGGSHKLPGYRFRSTSVWETPGESRRGSAPLAHGQQPGPSAKVSGRPAVSRWCWWAAVRGNHASRGFRLWAGGGSGECAHAPPHRERPHEKTRRRETLRRVICECCSRARYASGVVGNGLQALPDVVDHRDATNPASWDTTDTEDED